MKFKIGQVEIEVNNEDVSKAIETGELELKSDKLIEKTDDTIIYSKSDFETYTENIKKAEYKNTKDKAREMAMKDIRDGFGFTGEEIEGYKDVDTFTKKVKEKIIENAKIDPSKKLQTLENDLKLVRDNLKNKETEFEKYKQSVLEEKTRAKKDSYLLSLLPEKGMKVKPNIALLALKNEGLDINFNENKTEVLFQNEVLKNKSTLEPVDGKDFVYDKLKEMELFETPTGGAGGDDETGGGNQSGYDAFVQEMDKKGISEGSAQFSEEMNKRINNKTLEI